MKNVETNYPQSFKRPNGIFTLGLITNDRIFYCNLNEANPEKNVEVYDRIGKSKINFVANGLLGAELLYYNLISQKPQYINPTLKEVYESEQKTV